MYNTYLDFYGCKLMVTTSSEFDYLYLNNAYANFLTIATKYQYKVEFISQNETGYFESILNNKPTNFLVNIYNRTDIVRKIETTKPQNEFIFLPPFFDDVYDLNYLILKGSSILDNSEKQATIFLGDHYNGKTSLLWRLATICDIVINNDDFCIIDENFLTHPFVSMLHIRKEAQYYFKNQFPLLIAKYKYVSEITGLGEYFNINDTSLRKASINSISEVNKVFILNNVRGNKNLKIENINALNNKIAFLNYYSLKKSKIDLTMLNNISFYFVEYDVRTIYTNTNNFKKLLKFVNG